MSNDVASILGRWRLAERRLEASTDAQQDRSALIRDVIQAWLAYQAASSTDGPDEIVLIADRNRRYVAASDNAASLFGRDPVGLCIDEVSPQRADELESTWEAFASNRSMEGEYEVLGSADRIVRIRYRAFADVPLPGLFASHIVVLPAAERIGDTVDPGVGVRP
jgi:PAS domain-containing protein